MIIKTRSNFDYEVSTLVDFGKIDASSSLRADICTELFQISNGGYYLVETLNVISVQFLHLILESVARFVGPNII